MADLVDVYGNPITLRVPQGAQTDKALAGLAESSFSGHPTRGLTPARLHAILEAAEQGELLAQYDLFDDMVERDGHIAAEMQKRKNAILTVPWSIEPPKNPTTAEKQQAKAVAELFSGLQDLEDVLLSMMDAVGYAFCNLELHWQTSSGQKLISRAIARPAQWFEINPRGDMLLRAYAGQAEPLWPLGWMCHVHKARNGLLARAGLHRTLAWPYLFKHYALRDLSELLEIYGLPVRLGKYPQGASDAQKRTLLNALMSMGHNAAGIIPEGMAVEFLNAAKGGSEPFMAMSDWAEKTISKVILGGTLTSQADGKSSTNALGAVHNEVRHDLLTADALQIAGTISRDILRPLAVLNLPHVDLRRCPRLVFDTSDAADMGTLSMAIERLVKAGMPVPVSYAQHKLKIPAPVGDEPLLKVQGTAQPSAGLRLAALKTDPQPDYADAHAAQLADAVQPQLDGWLVQIQQLLARCKSLPEFSRRLPDLFAELPPQEMAKGVEMGLLAAELAGRWSAA